MTDADTEHFLSRSTFTVDIILSTSVVEDELVEIEAMEISNSLKCEETLFCGNGDECVKKY